jgi:SAM-dependent methyltransferase
VIGVERNPEQAEAALNLPEATGGCVVEFRIGDATDPPLNEGERGRFDLAHARFLLEHVPDPVAVVRAMVAAVKPGGRIVLADDDHDLMRFWPEPEGLMETWKAYYRSYRFVGTDPLIGRKLVGLLHDAGARPSWITQLFYGACAGSKRFHVRITIPPWTTSGHSANVPMPPFGTSSTGRRGGCRGRAPISRRHALVSTDRPSVGGGPFNRKHASK